MPVPLLRHWKEYNVCEAVLKAGCARKGDDEFFVGIGAEESDLGVCFGVAGRTLDRGIEGWVCTRAWNSRGVAGVVDYALEDFRSGWRFLGVSRSV